MNDKEFFKLRFENENLSKRNKQLENTFDKIKSILKESNVLPSLAGKLYLEDGVKIVKLIKEIENDN